MNQNKYLAEADIEIAAIRRVSKHTFATPVANNPLLVDAAGNGGRNMFLPGEISTCLAQGEKSAEAIVTARNEPPEKGGGLTKQ